MLRTRRYHTTAYMVRLYKAQLLGYIEYRTSAIYHATKDVLEPVDAVQKRFLKELGLTDVSALLEFNLAPLTTRRDIAMLGVIHRAVLKKGPQQFWTLFPTTGAGERKVREADLGKGKALLKRSLLGLVPIYNRLPEEVVSAATTQEFQRRLQLLGKDWATAGCEQWEAGLSPRGSALV